MRGASIAQGLTFEFGGKKAALRYLWQTLRYRLGAFKDYQHPRWGEVERCVFVCAGNICRSAYADGFARKLGLRAASFGLTARDDDPANVAAARLALARGLNLDSHRAQSLSSFGLKPGDLLLAMEPGQARSLSLARLPEGVQVTLLGLWAHPPRPLIEDPYGLCDEYFSTCFNLMEDALRQIAGRVKKAYAA